MVVSGNIICFDDNLMDFDVFGVDIIDSVNPFYPLIGQLLLLDLEKIVEKGQLLGERSCFLLLALGNVSNDNFLESLVEGFP